jgi:hypothetical protein
LSRYQLHMTSTSPRLRSGLWVNEGGSQLHLEISGKSVSGFYITAAKRPVPGKQYPIIGWANEDLIGFVVAWEESHSLTSWCGRYTIDGDGRECIKTVWHLGRLYEDSSYTIENPVWSSFITNTNTYYYTPR